MKNRKRIRGATMLESALVLNAMILLIFGMIEFGMAVYSLNFVKYAARDATRYASVRGATNSPPATNETITSFVRSQAAALDASRINVTTTWTPSNAPGSTVQVRVTYERSPWLTIISPLSYTIRGRSESVIFR